MAEELNLVKGEADSQMRLHEHIYSSIWRQIFNVTLLTYHDGMVSSLFGLV